MKDRKTWIVISYYSGLAGNSASHHVGDRLPHLRVRGIEPVIVTSTASAPLDGYRQIVARAGSPAGLQGDLRRMLKRRVRSKPFREALSFAIFLPLMPLYVLEKLLVKSSTEWSWARAAAGAAVRAAKETQASAIYATGGPVEALLAGAIAADRTGLPLLAEYQDPLPFLYCQADAAALEARVERSARSVIFLTQAAAESAKARSSDPGKVRSIYAGAEPRSADPSKSGGAGPILGHFGSLAGSRNLAGLLAGLERLESLPPQLRVRVVGKVEEEVLDPVRISARGEVFDIRGPCSREQALRLMDECDALVLLQHAEPISEQTIPSKAFEYLHSGRLVLGLTRNSELDKILADLGHVSAPVDDPEAIASALRNLFTRLERGDRPKPSPYTIESAVEELVSLLH